MNIKDYFISCLNRKDEMVFFTVKNGITYHISTTNYTMTSNYPLCEIIKLYNEDFWNELYDKLENGKIHIIHRIRCRISVITEFSVNFKQFENKIEDLKKKIRLEKIDKLLS